MPGSFEPNGLTRRLVERRAKGLEVLDLTQSNPTRAGFRYPEEAIRAALGRPASLAYDPDPRGISSAREAVAETWGHGLVAADLVLTASTSEAYAWLFKLIGDPGDEILVPSPSYPLFEWLARLEGLDARPIPALRFDGWQLDLAGLETARGPRTRAVVVVNPNNPTGQFLSRSDWGRLTAFCAGHGLLLVVDEVFSPYPLEPEVDALASALEDPAPPCTVAVLSGLSKAVLLPQMKLAWMAVRGPEAPRLLEGLEFIADQYLSLSAPVLAGIQDLLRLAPALQRQALDRLRGNLARLDWRLEAQPAWGRLRVGGGWSVLLRRPAVGTDEAFAETLLASQGVLLHPGTFFRIATEGHLVASLLTDPEIFDEGIRRTLRLDPPV